MSSDSRFPDHALLDRYFAGEATAEDSLVVERWLQAHPEQRSTLASLHAGLADPCGPLQDYAFDARVEAVVSHSLRAARLSPLHITSPRHVKFSPAGTARGAPPLIRRPTMWLATVVLLLVGLLVTRPFERREAARLQATTYRTVAQQRATVTLADGSKVTLAPQTTLIVESGFGVTTRTVSLWGHAYFDVASQERTPFIVQTSNMQTRVLGTTFDIRRYENDANLDVAVSTGRVAVSVVAGIDAKLRNPPLVLVAGMTARITDSTATVARAGDTAAFTDWTKGALVFRATPVSEMLGTLGRWYGYEFHIADSSIAQRQLTVTFNGQSAQDIMTVLKSMLDVSLTFDEANNHVVTLHAKRAGARRNERDRNTPWSPLTEVGR